MNIITKRPVRSMTATQIAERFSNLDSANKDSVKAFQLWFNAKYTKPPFVNKPLVVDGVYGKLSKEAYAKYGAEFEKTQPMPKKGNAEVVELDSPKKGLMDRFNELSTAKKAGVIIGGALVLGTLIYLVIPKKGKK